MKIGIEASAAVVSGRTGVGTYTANLMAGLERLNQITGQIELVHFSNRIDSPETRGPTAIASHNIHPHDQFPSRAIWMQSGLLRSISSTKPDICHFPNYLAPVAGWQQAPYVVTMHDMSVYRCPEHQPLKTVALHRAMIPAIARHAAMVLTVSESARLDILHYLKLAPEKVRVVYEGIGAQFRPQIQTGQPSVDEVTRRLGLDFPYVLTVGTLEPRKNHLRLIEAFTSMVMQERLPHHLVISGAHGWKDRPLELHAQNSALANRIHFLGYVPGADLPALYRGSSAFAFPSLYEGFGLPVLEALACGVPTLISTDPALTEVAGHGTTAVVQAQSVEDMASALYRLLVDVEYKQELRHRGYDRVKHFSWDKCAWETFQLYKEVLDESPAYSRLRTAN
jgi:glycosyltransferase involved in cell wall biosynthesis